MDIFWKIERLDRPCIAKSDTEYYRTNDNRRRCSYRLLVSINRALDRYNLVSIDDNLPHREKSDEIVRQICESRNNIEVPDIFTFSTPSNSNFQTGNLRVDANTLLDPDYLTNARNIIGLNAIWCIHYKCKIEPSFPRWNIVEGSPINVLFGQDVGRGNNHYSIRRSLRRTYRQAISWQKRWIFISSVNNVPQVVKYFTTFKKAHKFSQEFLRTNFRLTSELMPNFKENEFYVSDDANVRVGLYKDGEYE